MVETGPLDVTTYNECRLGLGSALNVQHWHEVRVMKLQPCAAPLFESFDHVRIIDVEKLQGYDVSTYRVVSFE
jgi:hypothetical protein